MEILSTGERIKRARIYKGYTLKRLCDNKISVSKMSCIENGKIKPEQWILEFVAGKLEIDIGYLMQDVKSQIIKNINDILKNPPTENYEKILRYNLKFAEEYSYNDICFKIMHILFNYYLNKNQFQKIQLMISAYYEYLQKCFSSKMASIYYMDIAKYFYISKEFFQAVNYYDNVIQICRENGYNEYLLRAMYYKDVCYIFMKDYDSAYELAVKIMNLSHRVQKNIEDVRIYHVFAVLSLKMNINKFHKYEKKVYELYGNNFKGKSEAMLDYSRILFGLGKKRTALNYLNGALNIYPKDDMEKLVDFVLVGVDVLLKNEILKKAGSVCDIALDYSISLNNIAFIEKAYYYKASILLKEGNYIKGEVYMNLSLDNLLKFGTNKEIYNRYMEMGEMYYKMNNVPESIKYFTFAISLREKYELSLIN
ncbi:MAG: helix-turn-helix domain-containing protein [Clostridium luticellarii]|jgi:tetratricopeptide (TPR) repeat protein|uniref:transcriptional regulator n=1 Tax=Clostridium luticellarii TaxID=1691940 RepID=UPI00235410B8|nr:transcriptional regulator [Clostridium luticellarii]MCI1945931.1 helix-turn-helix domain-containing protein [Clostridium luticellarii]MCI1996241.1 helix-turn-helix domain-containing protein [Clostridium luticellarii]MCI2040615.1 helix-turn-helix domain-containing protein [Clostridium luticellarii]